MINIGHDNYPTKYINSNEGYVCAYCFNTDLVIDDDIDEYGNYRGTVYYCTCEKAKLEQQMKSEIALLKEKESVIMKKYEGKLEENKDEVAKYELKDELYSILTRYMYAELDHLSDDIIVELFKESLSDYRRDYCSE